jgi:hypothetical protein
VLFVVGIVVKRNAQGTGNTKMKAHYLPSQFVDCLTSKQVCWVDIGCLVGVAILGRSTAVS